MLRIFRHYIPKTLLLLGAAEILILLVSIYLGAVIAVAWDSPAFVLEPLGDSLPLWHKAAAFASAIIAGMIAMGFYQREQRDTPAVIILRLTLSFLSGFFVMTVIYFSVPPLMVRWPVFAIALVCSFIGIATCRMLCAGHTDARFTRRVLVLGTGERAKQIENLRRASDRSGITLIGFVDIGLDTPVVSAEKTIRTKGSLYEIAQRYAADELVIAISDRRKGLPVDDVMNCKMRGIRILEDAEFFERQLGKIRLDAMRPSTVIFSDGFTQAVLKRTEKRVLDIILAVILLVVSLPVAAVIALLILLESGRPVLYRQTRVGHRGKPFTLYKFRSMYQDAEGDGRAVWATTDDSRITRVGHFVRKTRIDELPQLFNVLNGDMSFVGPRPERPEFVAELSNIIPYYDLRHHVKPGITGWAQVSYPYGASIKDAREKLQYDLYYLKNYSVFLDVNIILQTIQVILWGKGAR